MSDRNLKRTIEIDRSIRTILGGLDTEGDQQTQTRGALRHFTTGQGID
jgi:hypothetical protein